jgi:hypothetical protein
MILGTGGLDERRARANEEAPSTMSVAAWVLFPLATLFFVAMAFVVAITPVKQPM